MKLHASNTALLHSALLDSQRVAMYWCHSSQNFVPVGVAYSGHTDSCEELIHVPPDYYSSLYDAGHIFWLISEEYLKDRLDYGFAMFDQNRVWTGIGNKPNDTVTLRAPYLFLHQRRNSEANDQFHTFRLAAQFIYKVKKDEAKVE